MNNRSILRKHGCANNTAKLPTLDMLPAPLRFLIKSQAHLSEKHLFKKTYSQVVADIVHEYQDARRTGLRIKGLWTILCGHIHILRAFSSQMAYFFSDKIGSVVSKTIPEKAPQSLAFGAFTLKLERLNTLPTMRTATLSFFCTSLALGFLSYRLHRQVTQLSAPVANVEIIDLMPHDYMLRSKSQEPIASFTTEMPETILILASFEHYAADSLDLEVFDATRPNSEPLFILRGLRRNPQGHLTLKLSAQQLTKGTYRAILYDGKASANDKTIETYLFKVLNTLPGA